MDKKEILARSRAENIMSLAAAVLCVANIMEYLGGI